MATTTFLGPVVSKNGFVGVMEINAPQKVFSGDATVYLAAEYAGAFIVDTADSDTLKYSDGSAWKAVTLV